MAIPDAGIAHVSTFSIAKEATPGIAATVADVKMELIEGTIDFGLSTIRSRSMNPSGGSPRFIARGPRQPRILLTQQVNYQSWEHVWRAALGAYSSAVVSGATLDHTHKEGSLNAYTADFSGGDVPVGKVFRGVGGRLIELTIKGEVGGLIEATEEWAYGSLTENITPMTPASLAPSDGIPWDHAIAANILDGSGVTPANIPITGFEIRVGIPHKTNRLVFGQTDPLRPLRIGNHEVTWAFDAEFGDDDLGTKARTDAVAAGGLELLFRGAAITGGFYELSLKASSPHSGQFVVNVPNFDITTQRVQWQLQHNTADASALVVRTRSQQIALV